MKKQLERIKYWLSDAFHYVVFIPLFCIVMVLTKAINWILIKLDEDEDETD